MPQWLVDVAWLSLGLGILSSLGIALDLLAGHRQPMWIMNIVWPVTALYAGPAAVWGYIRFGRNGGPRDKPFWAATAVAATHCGSGCALADLTVESVLIVVPLSLFGRPMFAAWAIDFVVAFALGIVFQYFTIAPMRGLGLADGIKAAVKADTLSLTSWQVGMYGWMAIVTFLIFGRELDKTGPVFWFMMQIAMLIGFLTAFPVNWWLIRAGLKERM